MIGHKLLWQVDDDTESCLRTTIPAKQTWSLDNIESVIISFISQQKYSVGAQKNRLNEMVILCSQNTCEHWRYPPSKVEFCRNILSQNISVKSYLFLTEH